MDWTITDEQIDRARKRLGGCSEAIDWLMSHPGHTWLEFAEQHSDWSLWACDNLDRIYGSQSS